MNEHSRILVVRTDRMGDVVLTLPVFSFLRRRFPRARLVLLAGRYGGAIVEGFPHIDEIIWYDDPPRLVPFRVMLGRLRKERFDAAVVVHPTLRLAMLAFLSRIPLRVGTGYRYYSFLFNRRVYAHRKTAERHEVEYNLELLAPLDCAAVAPKPLELPIDIPSAARATVRALLERTGVKGGYAVMHPGSGGSAREWPPENFGILARRVVQELNLSVVVTGTARESALAEGIARAVPERVANLAGKLSVKELAALLQGAGFLVANSTGPLHVAVAVGTPVVGLYPRIPVMGPGRWGPYTDLARVLVPAMTQQCDDCTGRPGVPCACMASITPDTAYAAVEDLLAQGTLAKRQHVHES